MTTELKTLTQAEIDMCEKLNQDIVRLVNRHSPTKHAFVGVFIETLAGFCLTQDASLKVAQHIADTLLQRVAERIDDGPRITQH
jgi:hypothetical protein